MISATTLKDWGRSFDACMDIAVANLRAADPVRFEPHELGFHLAISDDNNPAARLLTPQVFASAPLRGDPVVVAASRRCLVVAGSEDVHALTLVARFVPDVLADESWPLCYAPMVLRDGRWQAFEPGLRDGAVADLHTLQGAFDYAEQRPLVQIGLAQAGRTEEIAELAVLPTHDGLNGALRSLALWDSPQSLLPRADFVVRRLARGGCVVRSWTDVEEAFGGFNAEPPQSAPYYSARDPLDAEALERMKAAPEPDFARAKGFGIVKGRLSVFG